jgi:hypothetical protein
MVVKTAHAHLDVEQSTWGKLALYPLEAHALPRCSSIQTVGCDLLFGKSFSSHVRIECHNMSCFISRPYIPAVRQSQKISVTTTSLKLVAIWRQLITLTTFSICVRACLSPTILRLVFKSQIRIRPCVTTSSCWVTNNKKHVNVTSLCPLLLRLSFSTYPLGLDAVPGHMMIWLKWQLQASSWRCGL